MLTIYIDNKPYQVKEGQNLLQACLSLGFDIPYFCWHPAMHSVGACRQCAVKQFKDEKDAKGRIVMSCMTPLSEGMRISVDDPDAKAFRKSVAEWLMLNHPHDCPVCDEGGECHLQDMIVLTGHIYRRTRFKKRTHQNQDLGPFVNHEMNRCIQCYRCVRFYRNIAGGRDLDVFGSHDHIYYGRHEDGVLESEFSGNLVEICPTGVFTDKTLKRHYARKWDLQTAPSICVHCGIGCNTIAGERSGTLRRILNRYNHEVNGYFLCDRGRFGYEFVNSEKRIKTPLIQKPLSLSGRGQGEGGLSLVSKSTAVEHITDILSKSRSIIGTGSPRASLESNFALRKLVGPDNFYSGMSPKEHKLTELIIDILRNGPARTPSLHDVQQADAVLILGEDVTNTAPMLSLAVRQAARIKQIEVAAGMKIPAWDDNAVRNAGQDERNPVYILSPTATRLDDIAMRTVQVLSPDIAMLGHAIAHEIDPYAPVSDATLPSSLSSSEGQQKLPLPLRERAGVRGTEDIGSLARDIAATLKSAKRPLIISGTGCMSEAIIQAAANVAEALCASGKVASLCYAALECNSMGTGLLDAKAIESLPQDIDTLIILENDLYRRIDEKAVNDLLARTKNVIVLDHIMTPTASKADIILPAATFAEAAGTLVNNEARAQRHYQVFQPEGDIQSSWKWIDDIMHSVKKSAVDSHQSFDELTREIGSSLSQFARIKDIGPSADFRIHGLKVPRQPHRYSGRTAMTADISVHEPKPPQDPDSPLAFSMEGCAGEPPASLISRYWSPGWNSVQSLNKFQQEVGGPLKGGDPGIRLIEPGADPMQTYFPIPAASSVKDQKAECPSYSIFGSEELSMHAPAVVERMTKKP